MFMREYPVQALYLTKKCGYVSHWNWACVCRKGRVAPCLFLVFDGGAVSSSSDDTYIYFMSILLLCIFCCVFIFSILLLCIFVVYLFSHLHRRSIRLAASFSSFHLRAFLFCLEKCLGFFTPCPFPKKRGSLFHVLHLLLYGF